MINSDVYFKEQSNEKKKNKERKTIEAEESNKRKLPELANHKIITLTF